MAEDGSRGACGYCWYCWSGRPFSRTCETQHEQLYTNEFFSGVPADIGRPDNATSQVASDYST